MYNYSFLIIHTSMHNIYIYKFMQHVNIYVRIYTIIYLCSAKSAVVMLRSMTWKSQRRWRKSANRL